MGEPVKGELVTTETGTGRTVSTPIPGRNGGTLTPFVKGHPPTPGAGRPSAKQLFTERVEARIDELFQTYVDGTNADDVRIRMQASEMLLDRAWGKAVQPLSVVPLDSELPGDDLGTA